MEKIIKRKRDELYAKWKSYDNSFNSWIDEATKIDLKKATGTDDTSNLALK